MRLEASDITVDLTGRRVLSDLSMSLQPGEIVGLLGPNGAGKTTLMRVLAGHLQTKGTVTLDGEAIDRFTGRQRARRIAYLPQKPVIGWPIRVADLVALGRLPWQAFGRGPGAGDIAICRDAMNEMDIEYLAERPATELSGGEQARVFAARALAQDTPILIADEPAAGLDPAHQIAMMAALRKSVARGRTVLVSLHDLTLAARWCDRVIVLKDGRLAAEGEPEVALTALLLEEVFGIAARIERDRQGLILAPTGLARDLSRIANRP